MKLSQVGHQQTELTYPDGVTVLYSYQTPVAAFVPGKGALCTRTKYSVTTSRHINNALRRWDATRKDVEQGVVDLYATREMTAK